MGLIASFVFQYAGLGLGMGGSFASKAALIPFMHDPNYLIWLAIGLLVVAGFCVGWLLEGGKLDGEVTKSGFIQNRLYPPKSPIIVQLVKTDVVDAKRLLVWLIRLKQALPTSVTSKRPYFRFLGLNEALSKQDHDHVILAMVADVEEANLNLEIQDVGRAQKLTPMAGDFPLVKLHSLLMPLPKAHQDLMALSVYGAGLRGLSDPDLIYHPSLHRWADRLSEHAVYIKQTQPSLSFEMTLAATWAYLWIGIYKKDEGRLRRVIEAYQQILEQGANQQGQSFAQLMLYSNLALAAHSLSQFAGDYRARHIAHQNAARALSFVDKNKQGALWAQLIEFCWRYVPEGSIHFNPTDQKAPNSPRFSEALFEEVRAFWSLHNDQGQINSLTKLHGDLVFAKANGMMGAHAFQKAEGLYLQALNETKRWEGNATPKHGYTNLAGGIPVFENDIHRALGATYFDWGRRCGNLDLIKKANFHWRAAFHSDQGTPSQKEQAKLKIAQTHLLLGGAANNCSFLEKAEGELISLDQGLLPIHERQNVARFIAVAKARATLLDPDATKQAIDSALQSVSEAGKSPQGDVWPTYQLLNRLAARLHGLGFEVTGNETYLAHAIDRRQAALDERSAGHDLDWIHDAGELAQLLAIRQNLSPNGDEDFFKAHYLIEEAMERFDCLDSRLDDGQCLQNAKADLWKVKAQLLGAFARQRQDPKSMDEAIAAYQTSLKLYENSAAPLVKANLMKNLAQLMIDQSEQFDQIGQLKEAESLFARAYDIYKAEGRMAQAGRMRGYIQNLAAAQVAYQIRK